MRLRGYIATLAYTERACVYVLPRKPIKPMTKSFIFTQNSHDHAERSEIFAKYTHKMSSLRYRERPPPSPPPAWYVRYVKLMKIFSGYATHILMEALVPAVCACIYGVVRERRHSKHSQMELYYCHITIYPHSLSTFYVNLLFNFSV